MTLYMIGLGLNDEKDITIKGLEAIKKCTALYLDSYTSILQCPIENLEKLYGKRIILAGRDVIEAKGDSIIARARHEHVGFLVVGDPFGATTHTDLYLRALKEGIDVRVIHNASVMNAIGHLGLELYKFGKTTSIPFPQKSYRPTSYYDIIEENIARGAHTLVLLDIRADENKFMRVGEGVRLLLEAEAAGKRDVISEKTMALGCARLGGDMKIVYAPLEKLERIDFGGPLHSLIVPGRLHFVEEAALEQWKNL